MEQLQIVNHEKLDAVLLMHAPRPRPQLQDRKRRRIVNEQWRICQSAGRIGQFREIRFVSINPSRTLRELTRASEHIMRTTSDSALISRLNTADRQFSFQDDMFNDVYRQRRFAHWAAPQ